MKKLLITFGFLKEREEDLKNLGYDVFVERENSLEFNDYMKDIEVVIGYDTFSKVDVDKFQNLKWIQLSSVGFEHLPKHKIKNKNIIVTNNKNSYSIPISEWIICSLLELTKRRPSAYKNKLDKKWYLDFKVEELYGKTVAFIGTGDISIATAKRLQAFGVKILGVNTTGREVNYFDKCYALESIDEVISESHAVILTLPHTEKTHKLMNKERLEKLRKDAIFINVSRGNIVDENSLIHILKENKIKGSALDVFEEEPLPLNNPLWELDNVILTCHNSWISENIGERRWKLFVENLRRYKEGEELLNIVDITKGY